MMRTYELRAMKGGWTCECGYNNGNAAKVCRRCKMDPGAQSSPANNGPLLPAIQTSPSHAKEPSALPQQYAPQHAPVRSPTTGHATHTPRTMAPRVPEVVSCEDLPDRRLQRLLLLISSEMTDVPTLLKAVHPSCGVILYDYEMSLKDLWGRILRVSGGVPLDYVAFLDHGSPGEWRLLDDFPVNLNTVQPGQRLNSFFKGLGDALNPNGRLDILACNLYANENGKRLVQTLEQIMQRNVAASSDVTGSGQHNFVLESDNVAADVLYFDKEKLAKWRGTACRPLTLMQQRMRRIKDVMHMYDRDNSRNITLKEFLAPPWSEGKDQATLRTLFKQIDTRGSGKITLATLDHFIMVETIHRVRDKFKVIDTDKNRQLTKDEWTEYAKSNGMKRRQRNRVWEDMDQNKNGKIQFKEFKEWSEDEAALEKLSMLFGHMPEVERSCKERR